MLFVTAICDCRLHCQIAAEKGEAFGAQAMGPERILAVWLIDGQHRAGEVMACVMAALLTRKVATVIEAVLQRGQQRSLVHGLCLFRFDSILENQRVR
jgi:hypothetical protein